MWFWALMVSTFLAAFFLVVTLAQVEAGARAKNRFMVLTFCFLVLVAVLIIFKPGKIDFQDQNVEVHPPVLEGDTGPQDVKKENNTAKPGSPSATGQNKSGKTPAKNGGEAGKPENVDPLVEEILQIKRQAEEKSNEAVTGETAAGRDVSTSAESAGSEAKQKDNSSEGDLLVNQPKKPPYKDPVLEALTQLKEQSGESGKNPSEKADGGESLSGAGDSTEQQKNDPADQKAGSDKNTMASVIAESVNFRDMGSLESKVVGTLNQGDTVEVLGKSETGDWSKIRLKSGETGWIMSNFLKNIP